MKVYVSVLPRLRANKLDEINREFEAAARQLTEGYPLGETLTWPAQMAEALAWGEDPATPTPYLDGLAAVRMMAPEEFRQRTLDKVNEFITASQYLVGKRQRLEDQLEAARTAAEIDSVSW